MTKKTKNLLLSLGAVVMFVTPVATVVACSNEDTNISALETLEKDGSSLQSILGAGASSETYASEVSVDDIVTALNSMEDISDITSGIVEIVNGDDLTGVLTFTVTWEETTYNITLEEFAINFDLLRAEEIDELITLLLGSMESDEELIIDINDYSILVEFFKNYPSPTDVTSQVVGDFIDLIDPTGEFVNAIISLLGTTYEEFLNNCIKLSPSDENGELTIEIVIKIEGTPIEPTFTSFKLIGFVTNS